MHVKLKDSWGIKSMMLTRFNDLVRNKSLLAYLKNSAWMIAEYFLKIIATIFVTIYVARYLGPEQFGVLSYILAITAIVKALTRLGMDGVLVRDLIKYPDQTRAYMGTAFGLMIIASLIGIVSIGLFSYLLESDEQVKLYIFIIATSLIFQAFSVIDFNFQSKLMSKYSAIAKSISFGISSIVKVYLVLTNAEFILIVASYVFDAFLMTVMLITAHIYKKQQHFTFNFDYSLISPLLKSAWPLVVSAASAILYMRIDQVMIGNMLDTSQLGLYSAASKVFEGWIMLSYIVSVSLLPAIAKLKTKSADTYEQSLIFLFRVLVGLGIVFAITTIFCSEFLIVSIFGLQFIEAEGSLIILMLASPFIALRTLSVRYMIVEGYENKIAARTLFTLFVNIILNWILIPIYGIEGAGISTLISLFIGSYVVNYFDSELYQLRRICNNSFFIKNKY